MPCALQSLLQGSPENVFLMLANRYFDSVLGQVVGYGTGVQYFLIAQRMRPGSGEA